MSIGSYAVQRKIRFKIVTLFLLSLLAIQILPKVLNWIFALGSDSFAELNNIDIKDAWFYLTTLGTVFSPPGGLKSALLIVEWVSMLIILILLFRYNSKILVKLGNVSFYVIISLILIITAKGYIAYAKNSDLYNEISRNFAVGSDITIIRSDVTTKAPDVTKIYLLSLTSIFALKLLIDNLFRKKESSFIFSPFLKTIAFIVVTMMVINWNYAIAKWEEDALLYIPHITKFYVLFLLTSSLLYRGIYFPIKNGIAVSYLFPFKWIKVGLLGLALDIVKAPGYIFGAILYPYKKHRD